MIAALRRCVPMAAGAVVLTVVLLAAGVPGAVLLAVGPVLVCVAMVLFMDHANQHTEGAERHINAARGRR
jgi:hypothetical protein